jgi:hypothetical protein
MRETTGMAWVKVMLVTAEVACWPLSLWKTTVRESMPAGSVSRVRTAEPWALAGMLWRSVEPFMKSMEPLQDSLLGGSCARRVTEAPKAVEEVNTESLGGGGTSPLTLTRRMPDSVATNRVFPSAESCMKPLCAASKKEAEKSVESLTSKVPFKTKVVES